jgi:hypothetical protein
MPSSREETTRLDIVVGGDRHAMEALELEIRRLARAHGVEIVDVKVTPIERRRPLKARRRAPRRRG